MTLVYSENVHHPGLASCVPLYSKSNFWLSSRSAWHLRMHKAGDLRPHLYSVMISNNIRKILGLRLVLFKMNNWLFGPYLAAIDRIPISVMVLETMLAAGGL
jgi:hypothetical protein